MDQQFYISQFIPGISFSDTDNMTTIERVAMWKRLQDFIKAKNKH